MAKQLHTLVLNTNYMPLSVFPLYKIPAEEAITRVLTGSAEPVFNYDSLIKTPSRNDLYWPSVIANKNGFKYSDEVKFKKETLYYRDHARCMYCGTELKITTLTYDHVHPRSKGGKHGWENVVASCHECNAEKSDAPAKGRWKPKQMPYKPTFFQLLDIRKNFPISVPDARWMEFLPLWGSTVTVNPPKLICTEV
jgi:5-methylcytosine-specific restriction endonuclease McrA